MLPAQLKIDPAWFHIDDMINNVISVRFSKEDRRILRKKKTIPVSEWSERHRIVPGDSSVPGRWRNSTTQYLAGIMDASFFPSVEEIIVCAPPQTGKSDVVNNCIGYAIDRKPGNVLYIYPDEQTAKENSKDRIQMMIKESPRLKSYTTGVEDDMSVFRIKLAHMKIYMGWASSASRLGNKPLPYVVLDEEDKYPTVANAKEATPAGLAKKRTRTFRHMRKIWRMSTPTVESGPIWRALIEESEVVFRYKVKCPGCGFFQNMAFESIHWPGGSSADPREVVSKKTAWYECTNCRVHWDDAARDHAVRAGKWIAAKREDRAWVDLNVSIEMWLKARKPKVIGFQYPSWITQFVYMSESAAAFLEGLRDKNKLKDFQNAHAAEPWVVYTEERKESGILALKDDRPAGMVPAGGVVSALTAAVDTQDYGFWYEIRAWGFGMIKESWQIKAGFVDSFEALEKVLWQDEYVDVDKQKYVVALTIQDAMGHRTADVYGFCRKHRGKILPAKGERRLAAPFSYSNQEFYPGIKKPIPGGLQLVRVHTTHFKNELATKLEISAADPGAWHLNSETTDDWAAQMTTETRDDSGYWINPKNKANHAWDCSALNLCAAEIIGVRNTNKESGYEKENTGQKTKHENKRRW